MHARDKFGVGELPDVDVVAANNTRQSFYVLPDLLDADMLRSGLQENASGSERQGNRGLENNHSDEKGNGRISVILAGPVSKPNDESSSHDTYVSESVADDVQNHGIHTHIRMAMAMALLSGLLGQSMVMSVVDARVPSRTALMSARLIQSTESSMASDLPILNEGRPLIVLFGNIRSGLGISVAVARGISRRSHTGGNDVLSEACGVDAHIFNAGEAGMPAPTGATSASATGVCRRTAGSSRRFIPTSVLVAKANSPVRIALGAGLARSGGPTDNDIGDIPGGAVILVVSNNASSTLLLIMDVAVAMRVVMIAIAVIVAVGMAVSVAAKDDKAE